MEGLFHEINTFIKKKWTIISSSVYVFCLPYAKLLFHICEQKTGLNTYEINYWQRKWEHLPSTRSDSQETPFPFSKINKIIKKKSQKENKKVCLKEEGFLR